MNRPGTGVVVQDVGRVVYDADGNLIFFAGGRKHSQKLLGEQVLCDALGVQARVDVARPSKPPGLRE